MGSTGKFKEKSSTMEAKSAEKSMMLKAVLQNWPWKIGGGGSWGLGFGFRVYRCYRCGVIGVTGVTGATGVTGVGGKSGGRGGALPEKKICGVVLKAFLDTVMESGVRGRRMDFFDLFGQISGDRSV